MRLKITNQISKLAAANHYIGWQSKPKITIPCNKLQAFRRSQNIMGKLQII